ncbi:MAG: hypothetical protein GY809_27365 [Planctomycetes bacterium]|nr:hypothetical protein [Planctomycetota bacterium]
MPETECQEGEGTKPSTTRRVWSCVVLVGLFLLISVLVKSGVSPNRFNARVGSGDPCNLRLEYVRPDCGVVVYDAQGRVQGRVLPTSVSGRERTWPSDGLMREFVFKCRVTEAHPLFSPVAFLSINGNPGHRVRAWLRGLKKEGPWVTLNYRAVLPRQGIRRYLGLGPLSLPMGRDNVHSVDAHITYHAGPRSQAAATFVGPFRAGQRIASKEDPNLVMEVSRDGLQDASYRISGPLQLDDFDSCMAYAADGRRVLLERGSGRSSSSRGASWEYRCQGMLPENTHYVTLGETPVQTTFYGITVDYPDEPVRVYPASWDEAFARVYPSGASPSGAVYFAQQSSPLPSMSDAVRIMDIAQGRVLTRVLNTFEAGVIDDLTQDEQSHLKDILNIWFENGREVLGARVSLWTGWPAYVDRTLVVLQKGDLGDRALRELISVFCKFKTPTPEQMVAVTELLLTKNICDPHVRRGMVNYVQQHARTQTNLLTRLAESDKPWLWCQIIHATGRFGDFQRAAPLSRTIQLRAVALGMDDWIDQAESLKPEAYAQLGALITPEFVQKDLNEFSRVFKAFVEHTSAEEGTPVLVGYLQSQVAQWHTWQVDGYASQNHSGIRMVVQQLNAWHDVNLGSLGHEAETYYNEHQYDWPQIARSALYWSRTREDQSNLPRGWQVSDQDLRVVWLNKLDPERSVIGVWPHGEDPNHPAPPLIMEMAGDSLHYTLGPDQAEASVSRGYSLSMQAGVSMAHSVHRVLDFTQFSLPRMFDPGPTNMTGTTEDGVRPFWTCICVDIRPCLRLRWNAMNS